MSPRRPTIDDLDDVDDEDGASEGESEADSDLSLEIRDADEVGLGGAPGEPRRDNLDQEPLRGWDEGEGER